MMVRSAFVAIVALCTLSGWSLDTDLYVPATRDWLIDSTGWPAKMQNQSNDNEIVVDNGLIARVFRTAPNFATVDLVNRLSGDSVLRGVKPEATIVLDGVPYDIGGLIGQPNYAYLDTAWLTEMTTNPASFQFKEITTGKPRARYPWKPARHSEKTPWPPKGVSLTATFEPPESVRATYDGLTVSIHYELYDGLPVIAKWFTVENQTSKKIRIDSASGEILAVNEEQKNWLHAESTYAFAGMETNHWGVDVDYRSQVNSANQSPILFYSSDPLGPGAEIEPGNTFESYINFILLHDSDERERQGLAVRKMIRTLFPQVTENPIFMHVRNSDRETVRNAVDQCAEVGFEMVILTFWSGFDIESRDPQYIQNFKEDVEYAHNKGIEIGGYTLMCTTRGAGDEFDCIDPETGTPDGSAGCRSACIASDWYDGYSKRVFDFVDATGMDIIETDGPYHGVACASTKHTYHQGLNDSQYQQWRRCIEFYTKCLQRGMYINTPDRYYFHGTQKYPMGYREDNWSLPRWQQILIARQNIFDGTFLKPPSMGWMLVPLVEYHGGGAAATLEPLSEHLQEYEWHLAYNFGSGTIACYRGPRLYDTEATKAVVKKWVDFYKQHREILSSDIIHVRRADNKTIDCMFHVNPELKEKGLAMVYNQLDEPVKTTLQLPLYYTGLTESAQIRERDGQPKQVSLGREYNVEIPIEMEPKSISWFVVE